MNIFYKYIRYAALCTMAVLVGQGAVAQEVQNRVVNIFDQPIGGALLVSEFGDNQYFTPKTGIYMLIINDGSSFVTVSAAGYLNQRISVEQLNKLEKIVLKFDNHNQGGYINTGYDLHSRESFTGAVATVSGDVINRTPSNVLSETYQGRLTGVSTISAIPELTFFGYNNTSMRIRGRYSNNDASPLIIIDGVVTPTQYYEFISPKEIASITALKDASATAIYGIQGASGAIVITTKRGYSGPKKIEAYGDFSVQQMTRRPPFYGSARYAELRNEAGERDGLGPYSQFSQDEIDHFAAGDDISYPNNDWYDIYMRKAVTRQRVGVNVIGGNDTFHYFSDIGFVNQEEPFKITDEPDRSYDPTPNVKIVNFRSNMDAKFSKYVSGYMRLTGSIKREQLSGGGTMGWNIYSELFNAPPTMFGPVSPIIEDEPTVSNKAVVVDGFDSSVYGILNRSGYTQVIETNVIAQVGLKVDMSFLTKGLSVSGAMAYQTYVRNATTTTQSYVRVIRDNSFDRLDNFSVYKTYEDTPLAYGKGHVFFYYLDLFANAEYNRRFGEHSIDASAHTYYLLQEKEATGSGNSILPYKRQNFGLSVLYGYKDRYFLKGDIGYSGSEQFHPDYRYTATPAISAAYILSKEDFFENDYVSLLKLRASYGITANDQMGTRFAYLTNIRADGRELEYGNPKLEAEKIKKLNLGIDLGLFDMVTVGFDYFTDKVDNMLISGSNRIPQYQGIALGYYPKINAGKMENAGYELTLGFNKHFNKELAVNADFHYTFARNKVIDVDEAPYDTDYPYRYHSEGYRWGQQWGYLVDYSNGNGMFNSADELATSGLTYSFGAPRLGDLKYIDLNNDGVIDAKDVVPMGYPSYPEVEYALNLGATWKNWEIALFFQGVSNWSSFTTSLVGVKETATRYGYYSDLHQNAWTPERYAAGESITFPALSLSTSSNHQNSDYFLQDRSFVRLKNVELAYTLPDNIARKIRSERVRLAINVHNVFTIDNMKTKYIDPEIFSMTMYQPYRVYNLGLSVNF
ncbi:MAG: SusC/RagA family TonB-linked outer membrane protein [Bacteroidales bacterium]|jgi:TonB-linked SusC/RagA family outer membrane protein|nr:SusC/RagA family TonB-linked outer membrane protein [Bacteroidales bacterium]